MDVKLTFMGWLGIISDNELYLLAPLEPGEVSRWLWLSGVDSSDRRWLWTSDDCQTYACVCPVQVPRKESFPFALVLLELRSLVFHPSTSKISLLLVFNLASMAALSYWCSVTNSMGKEVLILMEFCVSSVEMQLRPNEGRTRMRKGNKRGLEE